MQIRESNPNEYQRWIPSEYPSIIGYHSGIFIDRDLGEDEYDRGQAENSIGNWAVIIDTYQRLADQYATKHPGVTALWQSAKALRILAQKSISGNKTKP